MFSSFMPFLQVVAVDLQLTCSSLPSRDFVPRDRWCVKTSVIVNTFGECSLIRNMSCKLDLVERQLAVF